VTGVARGEVQACEVQIHLPQAQVLQNEQDHFNAAFEIRFWPYHVKRLMGIQLYTE